jgi:hypothetical protein
MLFNGAGLADGSELTEARRLRSAELTEGTRANSWRSRSRRSPRRDAYEARSSPRVLEPIVGGVVPDRMETYLSSRSFRPAGRVGFVPSTICAFQHCAACCVQLLDGCLVTLLSRGERDGLL